MQRRNPSGLLALVEVMVVSRPGLSVGGLLLALAAMAAVVVMVAVILMSLRACLLLSRVWDVPIPRINIVSKFRANVRQVRIHSLPLCRLRVAVLTLTLCLSLLTKLGLLLPTGCFYFIRMPIIGCPVLKIKVVTNPLFLMIILREWVI
jgi:hypothetical protein